ncbi:MAG: AraC family transcriptional regulator [Vallitalea sp.]|jgi:AraC-like DNA-binding protein|nr:AraC family transcriptional regulator [Vallitalea sp.]MCT4597699.1 AraC family transcriptional regulator [Vallitalea sp.]
MDGYELGNNIELTVFDDGDMVCQMRSNDGNGVITSYQVLDGIRINYNDFHMSSFRSEFVSNTNMFCVDHCKEGRIEQEIKSGVYSYIETGDLRIDNRFNHNTDFYFPLSHYHGITIAFEVDKADASIKKIFPDFPVSVVILSKKFCHNNRNYFLRSATSIEHIFSELYNVPQEIKLYYYKIKVLELLLFLSGLEIDDSEIIKPYFYKSQTEKIKSIHTLITSDIQKHYTLEQLSEKYNISLTGMKTCFKAVYGDSLFAYLRKYRINKATMLLRTTDLNIAAVANEVGYNSPSKFSAAFKKEIGINPLEYRNTRMKR